MSPNIDILNEDIIHEVIKVIKNDGTLEIMKREDALNLAKSLSLDLWMVCEDNLPPLCAIINYTKIKREQVENAKSIILLPKEMPRPA